MRSQPTTGTSPTNQRTTGLRSWTVALGWRTGRVLIRFPETRTTHHSKDGPVLFPHP